MAQLRQAKNSFDQAGAQVVLVGMGTPEESRQFLNNFDVPFALVSDPEQNLYRQFDLKRLSPMGFFSPSLALRGLTAMAKGHAMGMPQGDVRQLPGVFVIDTRGRIIFSHYASDPADHPDTTALLAALP